MSKLFGKLEVAKICNTCGEAKPLEEFRKYSGRSKDGRRPICKKCQNAYDREYRAKRKEEKGA